KGQCGKRPLRGLNRKKVVNEILHKKIHVYKADKRRELQQQGDPDPSILPKDNVLSKAESDDKKSQYLDKDLVSALSTKIMHAGNTKSHSLYLHLGIINCELGQYAVCSAITEKQDTVTIQGLLLRFIQAGTNHPKQVFKPLRRSETDGLLKNGQQTKTEKCKSALKALITDELDEYEKLCYVLDVFSDFVTSFKILFKGKGSSSPPLCADEVYRML
ncbi:hypothetical protein PV326_014302, partial [Microctonus aethiopoides]